MKRIFALLFFLGTLPAQAQSVTPNFTTGSMTQTVSSSQTINETIAIERFGGTVTTWKGDNVSASGPIEDSSTTFSIVDTSLPWQLEIVTRSAGIIETEDITRTITTTATTNTLSVFSQ